MLNLGIERDRERRGGEKKKMKVLIGGDGYCFIF